MRNDARCVMLVLACPLLAAAAQRGDTAGAILPLPEADRAVLDRYLGEGVIGAPVEARPIEDPPAFYGLGQGTSHARFASRTGGAGVSWMFSRIADESGARWRGDFGRVIRVVRESEDGHVEVVSETNRDHGVVTTFTPAQRRLSRNLAPGESEVFTVNVKVYDLDDPEELEHSGSLELTNTYVGAYSVSVPAGTFDAVLIRLEFRGKVGPARIRDTVYYLLAEGIGPVAFVENKDISAMRVYRDEEKIGLVLERARHAP